MRTQAMVHRLILKVLLAYLMFMPVFSGIFPAVRSSGLLICIGRFCPLWRDCADKQEIIFLFCCDAGSSGLYTGRYAF